MIPALAVVAKNIKNVVALNLKNKIYRVSETDFTRYSLLPVTSLGSLRHLPQSQRVTTLGKFDMFEKAHTQ